MSAPTPQPTQSDFIPLRSFERTLSAWWLIAACAILGGLVGLLVHAVRPPLYEARAVLAGNVNFSETGSLTELELDYALDSLGNLIRSGGVLDTVTAQAAGQGWLDADGKWNGFVERKASRWILRVRHPNPQAAAGLANLWADTALAQLEDAYAQARQAQALGQSLAVLEGCLAQPQAGACPALSPPELLQAISDTTARQTAALNASRGVLASLLYSQEQRAAPPDRPALFGRNSTVLACTLIGLTLGFWLAQTTWPDRLRRPRRG